MVDREKKLDEIFSRAERLRQRDALRRRVAADAAGTAVCAALLVLLLATVLGLRRADTSEAAWRYGALLLNGDYGGYILVAAVSMALGALATVLCARLRRLRRMDGEREEP